MELLESFVDKTKDSTAPQRFEAGQLTIVDMSDPFIDSGIACGFFEILVRLFVREKVDTGKVLVVDEAHKVSLSVLQAQCYTNMRYCSICLRTKESQA